jgi:hypothetical protein
MGYTLLLLLVNELDSKNEKIRLELFSLKSALWSIHKELGTDVMTIDFSRCQQHMKAPLHILIFPFSFFLPSLNSHSV